MNQFALVCDSAGMEAISRLCNGTVQFLPINGMTLQGENALVLTTPIPQHIDALQETKQS
jgi:hypothetical protein